MDGMGYRHHDSDRHQTCHRRSGPPASPAPALAPYLGWFAIPVAYLVGMVFVLIEAIGWFLEDPFENTVMDTPMTAICRTIEINLREQLGETELPGKLEPVKGVLM